jgi:hypothetical protein
MGSTYGLTIIAVCLACSACAATDRYGGWDGVKGDATGHFHAQQVEGRWWIIDPDGNAFISKGVCHVSWTADQVPATRRMPYHEAVVKRYANEAAWASAIVERLRGWGFDTIGAWSSASTWRQDMPYTVILGIGARAGGSWLEGTFPDVFSDDFRKVAEAAARESCAERADDPYVLGYFTDNELRWSADWRSRRLLFDDFMALPAQAPGKRAVVDFLAGRSDADIGRFNATWGQTVGSFDDLLDVKQLAPDTTDNVLRGEKDAFLRLVAEQYFRVCREAILKYDPHHMVLGCRFAGYAPEPVLAGCKDHVDIVSFNNYDAEAPSRRLSEIHAATGRPVMITEFSFKAMDSGLPNTKGAGRPVATQKDRADAFERYVRGLMALPFVVGYHWFEHADEPKEGRFDGENSNYGLVNINDEPWDVLTQRMTQVNGLVYELANEASGR